MENIQQYLTIFIMSMIPINEVRGTIPFGITQGLKPVVVYLISVMGATLVSIPLIVVYRPVIKYFKTTKVFSKIASYIDDMIEKKKKKMKSLSIVGVILFVAIPLPTTGTWSASAIASILRMRMWEGVLGVFIGNIISGIIVMSISLYFI